MAEKSNPLRILCIHGYRQNSSSFRQKLGAFRKACGKRAEFVFFDAPHLVPTKKSEEGPVESEIPDETTDERGWWFSAQNDDVLSFNALEDSKICPGFEESLRAISEAESSLGPFDGLLSFSQGAAMAGLFLAAHPHAAFRFVIFVAGFKSKSEAHQHLYDASRKITIPSLHVFGDTDGVIPKPMSLEYLDTCENPQTLNHPGGHFVPAAGPQKKVFNAFLDDMISRK